MSRTLRSPFENDASQGYPIQRQTPLSSPGIYSAPQPRDTAANRSPTVAPNMRRVSGDATVMSPMGLSANFPPYLGHFGQTNIASPTQRRSFTYDTYQQERSRAGEIGARSASFSSGIPAHASRVQTGRGNLQAPTPDKTESQLAGHSSFRISLEMTAHNEAGITSTANLANTFSPRGQHSNTFANLPPDTVSCEFS